MGPRDRVPRIRSNGVAVAWPDTRRYHGRLAPRIVARCARGRHRGSLLQFFQLRAALLPLATVRGHAIRGFAHCSQPFIEQTVIDNGRNVDCKNLRVSVRRRTVAEGGHAVFNGFEHRLRQQFRRKERAQEE